MPWRPLRVPEPRPYPPPRPSGSTPVECIMHALTASMRINLRSPPGGSTMRYVTGTFSGMHFAPVDYVTQFTTSARTATLCSSSPVHLGATTLFCSRGRQISSMPPSSQPRRRGWRGAVTLLERVPRAPHEHLSSTCGLERRRASPSTRMPPVT